MKTIDPQLELQRRILKEDYNDEKFMDRLRKNFTPEPSQALPRGRRRGPQRVGKKMGS